MVVVDVGVEDDEDEMEVDEDEDDGCSLSSISISVTSKSAMENNVNRMIFFFANSIQTTSKGRSYKLQIIMHI